MDDRHNHPRAPAARRPGAADQPAPPESATGSAEAPAFEEMFRLFEFAPDAMVVSDRDGAIVFVNSYAERLFGYAHGELIGQKIEILVPGSHRRAHQRERAEYIAHPRTRPMGAGLDLHARRKDGVEIPVDISLGPMRTSHGTFVVSAVRDITERKRAARALEDANARLRQNLEAAAKIQAALLPRPLPDLEGTRFAWIFRPCEKLAGDIFNIFLIGDERLVMYLLDVSGHGVVAALQSVTLSRVLAAPPWPSDILDESCTPAEIAERLNRRFPIDPDTWQYFTLLCGVLDLSTHEFRFVSAGHPGPILVPREGEPRILQACGFPIGLFPDAQYDEVAVELRAGDRVFLYSDGVTEAMNEYEEDFGKHRLIQQLVASRDQPLPESLAALVGSIEAWCGGQAPEDDVSVLGLEIAD